MQHAARPQALIFDLDGLLVDSEPIWFEVEGSFLAELGHVWTQQEAEACMGQGTPNTLRIWRERYNVDVDIARDTGRIIDRMVARAEGMALQPGAATLLQRAKREGCPMAVASSSPRRLIEAVLQAKQISPFFRVVVSAQEVTRPKPAPDVFLRAGALLDVGMDACVVLEDTLAGTRAGIDAGARVLAVPSVQSQALRELATWVLDDLDQAVDVLFPSG